jgi:hypothetical protein
LIRGFLIKGDGILLSALSSVLSFLSTLLVINMNDSIGDTDAIELLTESYDTLDTEKSIKTAD